MIQRILWVLFLVSACVGSYAQEEASNNFKLGIKTGVNFSTLLGSEFQNARPRFGYTAGFFYRQNYGRKKNNMIQSEILATFRGSNFANPVGDYQSIPIFSLDMPVLFGIPLATRKYIVVGPQVGYIALSSMYTNKALGKAYLNDVPFKPFNLDACIGYQSYNRTTGFQALIKNSVLNMNDGIFFEDINPPTGNGGTVYSFGIELSLLF